MNNEINKNELDLTQASNDLEKIKKIMKKIKKYFLDGEHGIKIFLVAIRNNVRLKKEMSTMENESKERLLIYNKILQIKSDLEFKFFDKLLKNFVKIMKNFEEINKMIEKEIKTIEDILSKNKTIHIIINMLFKNITEDLPEENIKQGIFLEILNVNQKIEIFKIMYCNSFIYFSLNQCKKLIDFPYDYFYENNKEIKKNVMNLYNDIINKIE